MALYMPRGLSLSGFLDHFIPAEIQVQPEAHRRARMFMLSHVFGPVLGNSLPLYMIVANIAHDYRVFVFALSIIAFWLYPFALRRTGRYQLLAFLSVQNLIFCVLWACYAFGGTLSPFLPWLLIFPLLAFLYLPPQGRVRNILIAQIFGSTIFFLALDASSYPLPYVDLAHMQVIGMISMAAVAIYFAMMSLYFAKMFQEQREFTREINALVSTSENLRNLTLAANQASAAKADFVAGMSHELRTPLNAIIGYSQMLIEEAREEEDEMMASDLGSVHKAGSDLLRLIDDILDYSRIDAEKMPFNPSFDSWEARGRQIAEQACALIAETRGLVVEDGGPAIAANQLLTDWNAAGSAIRHLIVGIASHHADGCVLVRPLPREDGLHLRLFDLDPAGQPRPIPITQEMFEHNGDASASKYGGTGIEIALSFKFIQLLGGTISSVALPDGSPATDLFVPDNDRARRLAA